MTYHYRCSECGKNYEMTPDLMVCPECYANQTETEPLKGILEVVGNVKPKSCDSVYDFLPVERKFFPSIPVGETPLWKPENFRTFGFSNLYVKDDTCNPTGSLKDRASFLVAAFARKHGIKNIVVASTGNAASSMAGVGAAAGLGVTIFIPKSAPEAKMIQSLQYGANVILVDGNYDCAYELSLKYVKKFGGLSRNTAYNPLTIEGKKTVAIEIVKDLGKSPDYVFVPTGDGVIIAGVYKGFRDLKDAGLIKKVPVVYAAQSSGSDAITRAFNSGRFDFKSSNTIADSISVDIPRNGYHALKNMKEFGGKCVVVSDREILEAQHKMAALTGLFGEPAGATSFAGFLSVKDSLEKDAAIVILVTGNGLKDSASALKGVNPPKKAIKSIDEIK